MLYKSGCTEYTTPSCTLYHLFCKKKNKFLDMNIAKNTDGKCTKQKQGLSLGDFLLSFSYFSIAHKCSTVIVSDFSN